MAAPLLKKLPQRIQRGLNRLIYPRPPPPEFIGINLAHSGLSSHPSPTEKLKKAGEILALSAVFLCLAIPRVQEIIYQVKMIKAEHAQPSPTFLQQEIEGKYREIRMALGQICSVRRILQKYGEGKSPQYVLENYDAMKELFSQADSAATALLPLLDETQASTIKADLDSARADVARAHALAKQASKKMRIKAPEGLAMNQ